jgi:hypothetical protein
MPIEGQALLAVTLWLGFWGLLSHVQERSAIRKQQQRIRRLYPRPHPVRARRRRPQLRPRAPR